MQCIMTDYAFMIVGIVHAQNKKAMSQLQPLENSPNIVPPTQQEMGGCRNLNCPQNVAKVC